MRPLTAAFAFDTPLFLGQERSGINAGMVNLGTALTQPACRGAIRTSLPGAAIGRIESHGAVARVNATVRSG